MNLSHDALRDLTALTELKSDGGILERQFLQLKEHFIKGYLVGTSSLEGMRMSLQQRRIGGISEEEHAADVDGKVVEILKNNDCVDVGGGLERLLHHSFCLLPLGTANVLLPVGKANVLRPTQHLQQAASQSTEASGKGSGLWQTPWATSLRHTSRRTASRWCGFTLEVARTHCSPSMQALGHSSRSWLGSSSTSGLRTGTIWTVGEQRVDCI